MGTIRNGGGVRNFPRPSVDDTPLLPRRPGTLHGGRRLAAVGCLLPLVLTAFGCAKPPAKVELPPPKVGVVKPTVRPVVDHVDFTGRTEAPFSVDIRSRVTGYLVQMPFVEGTEVKKGDLLFEIDPRPYQAQLDQAQGDVVLNKARLKLAQADNARAKNIAAMNAGAISKQDLDKYQAAEEEADASVAASTANLEQYKINLEFTKVTSPIDGRVGRYNLTLGNLVNADQTLLTTVVSQDPMYVYFDLDEMTVLRIVRRLMGQKVDGIESKSFPVLMALGDEDDFPHVGYLNFADNVVKASTGTLTVRGAFPNPDGPSGRRLLKPGMFVRVRLPLGKPRSAVLVPERAIGTDQGRKFLLTLGEGGKVLYRAVTVGPLQDDGLRVIETGLADDETVIVSGLQLVRAGMSVQSEFLPATPAEPTGTGTSSTGTGTTGTADGTTGTASTATAFPPPSSAPAATLVPTATAPPAGTTEPK